MSRKGEPFVLLHSHRDRYAIKTSSRINCVTSEGVVEWMVSLFNRSVVGKRFERDLLIKLNHFDRPCARWVIFITIRVHALWVLWHFFAVCAREINFINFVVFACSFMELLAWPLYIGRYRYLHNILFWRWWSLPRLDRYIILYKWN